ncbi:piggyBac transposable element-derived protein 4-like [Nilaparvata lugens]|uniref:piggyBac transposable element-derived protein 4-like n=1 Tax=Nilaparvata lugens TaxID=108931 RepID=UPI00193E87E4|nr:piggyBac transposable element-derived protein 4-like [Nilaparvata lugens]
MVDGTPYLGKKTPTEGQAAADYFVKTVTKSIHGSNRSVTTDNWFTNIPLADELLKPPYNLTIVGTIRLNRKGVPKDLGNKKERPVGSSMFLFDKEETLVSYKPKANKVVVLLSTMHSGMNLNPDTKKPEIIHTYNSTKGAVDTLDKMCGDMSCSRKTRHWPLCVFYGIMNIAFVNSYVIYCMNNIRLGNKPMNRKSFMKELCQQLTEPHMRTRLQTPNLRRNTRMQICEILGIPMTPEMPQGPGPRRSCFYCPAALRRMTTTYCGHCNNPICGQHRAICCVECDK